MCTTRFTNSKLNYKIENNDNNDIHTLQKFENNTKYFTNMRAGKCAHMHKYTIGI